MEHNKTLLVFALIILLNIVDVSYTLYWFSLGIPEGNPILAFIANQSHALFAGIKMLMVIIPLAFLWTQKDRHPNYIKYGCCSILAYYTLLAGYHGVAFVSFSTNQPLLLHYFLLK